MTPTQRKALAASIAVALAAPLEGTRQWAYRDTVGIPTICMGSTKGVRMGDFKTLSECNALLTTEMLDAVNTVEACAPGLPAQTLAAFADATYNLGPVLVCDKGESAAARLLGTRQIREACNELPRWNKARKAGILITLPGLTKRRQLEKELCLKGLE